MRQQQPFVQKPRILAAIVVPPHMTASGAAGAAERLSAALALHCDVTVASMMPPQIETEAFKRAAVRTMLPAGLRWGRVPNRFRTLFYRSDISRLIKPGAFDLVHLHNPMPALEMGRVARACRRAGIPYVVSTHGFNEIANGHVIYRLGVLQRLAWGMLVYDPVCEVVRGADAVLMLSPSDTAIIRSMGYKKSDLFTVPNGIEPPKAVAPARSKEILRKFDIENNGSGQGAITCMFLANHTPNKGLPTLLEAFARLDLPYNLIIGGERRAEVDYSSFVGRVKARQKIIITGRLENDEVTTLMRRSDLFIFPTLADTLPLVVFEALAHGLPVVASEVGGIPHQIDESCGVLVPPGDSLALATEVTRLAGDPARLSRMRSNTMVRAAELPNWADAARRAELAYSFVHCRAS